MPSSSLIAKTRYAPYNGVVLYHWNKCWHCIEFRDTWNKLYDTFIDSIPLIAIELDDMKKIPIDYQVNAFPTIYLYSNGKQIPYDDLRDFNTLKTTINSKILKKQKK